MKTIASWTVWDNISLLRRRGFWSRWSLWPNMMFNRLWRLDFEKLNMPVLAVQTYRPFETRLSCLSQKNCIDRDWSLDQIWWNNALVTLIWKVEYASSTKPDASWTVWDNISCLSESKFSDRDGPLGPGPWWNKFCRYRLILKVGICQFWWNQTHHGLFETIYCACPEKNCDFRPGLLDQIWWNNRLRRLILKVEYAKDVQTHHGPFETIYQCLFPKIEVIFKPWDWSQQIRCSPFCDVDFESWICQKSSMKPDASWTVLETKISCPVLGKNSDFLTRRCSPVIKYTLFCFGDIEKLNMPVLMKPDASCTVWRQYIMLLGSWGRIGDFRSRWVSWNQLYDGTVWWHWFWKSWSYASSDETRRIMDRLRQAIMSEC
jgi:hypothetical protein